MKYCSNCGKRTEGDAPFCSGCGAKLANTTKEQALDAHAHNESEGLFFSANGVTVDLQDIILRNNKDKNSALSELMALTKIDLVTGKRVIAEAYLGRVYSPSTTKVSKKNKGCITILLWFFFLPIMAILAIGKNQNISKTMKAVLISSIMVFCMFVFTSSRLGSERAAEEAYINIQIAVENKDYLAAQAGISEFLKRYAKSEYNDELLVLQATVKPEAERIQIEQQAEAARIAAEREAEAARIAAAKAAENAKKAEQDKHDYINSSKTISFTELSRNPDKYKGESYKFVGKVVQVSEPTFGNTVSLRINVTRDSYGHWKDTVYAVVVVPSGSDRILKDDIITFFADCDGLYSYTSVLGAKISLPKFTIRYFSIN